MPDFPFLYTPFAFVLVPVVVLVVIATIVLKGFALWHAARGGQKKWFIALLVINTAGVLEIVYLIWFRPKSSALAKHEEPPVILSSPARH
ncbi:MAG: DUF5652 family protein [bacterium]|nr:DUF5652 family protein [bacterium]